MARSSGRRCRPMVTRSPSRGTARSEQDHRPGRDHFDIYLKLVGSSDVRRLTTDPGRNWAGGWSPDGRQIACVRDFPERRDLPLVASQRSPAQAHRLSGLWTRPAGRRTDAWLIVAGHADGARMGAASTTSRVDGGPPRSCAATQDGRSSSRPPRWRRTAIIWLIWRARSSGRPVRRRCRGPRRRGGKPVSDASSRGEEVHRLKAASSGARDGTSVIYTRRRRRRRSICGAHGSPAIARRNDSIWQGWGRACRRYVRRQSSGVRPHAEQHRRLHARRPAPRPVLVTVLLGHPAAVLARRHPARLHLVAVWRGARRLARRGGRLQCSPVDAWPGAQGLAVLVARRSPDCV